MDNELEKSFREYISFVKKGYSRHLKKAKSNIIHLNPNYQEIFDSFESSREFEKIEKLTFPPYVKDKHLFGLFAEAHHSYELHAFFRNSGCYKSIIDNKDINVEALVKLYQDSISKSDEKITYYLPIQYLKIKAPEDCVDFGMFKIKKYTKEELDEEFMNSTNRLFYPQNEIDTKILRWYWILSVSSTVKYDPWWQVEYEDSSSIISNKTNYPKPVEEALRILTLFRWESISFKESEGDDISWSEFDFPFIIKITDNIFQNPHHNPNYLDLDTEPIFDDNGKFIEMAPSYHPMSIYEDEVEEFREFIMKAIVLYNKIKGNLDSMEFLEVAFDFFLKAFMNKGFEQLLWHITTIEALLGESTDLLTRTLSRRVAIVLGSDKTSRIEIFEEFKKLYIFRSSLVHGKPIPNKPDKSLKETNLNKAREYARQLILWVMEYVNANKNIKSSDMKKEMLYDIDLMPEKIPKI